MVFVNQESALLYFYAARIRLLLLGNQEYNNKQTMNKTEKNKNITASTYTYNNGAKHTAVCLCTSWLFER